MFVVVGLSKVINGNKKDSGVFVDSFLEGWSDFDEEDLFGFLKGDKFKKIDDKKIDVSSKKRKGIDVFGLEIEVDKKKVCVFRVKFDDVWYIFCLVFV